MGEKLFLTLALAFIALCIGAILWALGDPSVALLVGAP
jgi:hypothetical protein